MLKQTAAARTHRTASSQQFDLVYRCESSKCVALLLPGGSGRENKIHSSTDLALVRQAALATYSINRNFLFHRTMCVCVCVDQKHTKKKQQTETTMSSTTRGDGTVDTVLLPHCLKDGLCLVVDACAVIFRQSKQVVNNPSTVEGGRPDRLVRKEMRTVKSDMSGLKNR